MIRFIISESGNSDHAPAVTGVHRNQAAAEFHMASIRRNYSKDGYVITENTDVCFTVSKGQHATTFAMQWVKFD